MDFSVFKPAQKQTEVVVKDRTKAFLALPKTKQEMVLFAATEYAKLNEQEKLLEARRKKEFKPIVDKAAETWGIEDENGSLHLVVDGAELVKQRKVSISLNPIAAEELLRKKKLYDACVVETVTYELDEGKIMDAYQAGKISAKELDDIFSEKVTWATIVTVDSEEIDNIKKLRKKIEKGVGGVLELG